jgi:hypothetical protein
VKVNRHNVREERRMGIDQENIYNLLPKSRGFLGEIRRAVSTASTKRVLSNHAKFTVAAI